MDPYLRGRIIKNLRKEKGITQAAFAMLTGLKQPSLSRIETGHVDPRPATLTRIMAALGVDASVFNDEVRIRAASDQSSFYKNFCDDRLCVSCKATLDEELQKLNHDGERP